MNKARRHCLWKLACAGALAMVLLFVVSLVVPLYIKGFDIPVQGKHTSYLVSRYK